MALRFGWVLIPLAFLYVITGNNAYYQYVAGFVVIYGLSALGLDWLMGRAGVVSLGNGALMAFGALVAAYLTQHDWGSFPVVLLVVTLLGGVVGAILSIPASRLHGVYFALVTLALHIIVVFVGRRYQATDDAFVAGIPVPRPSVGSFEIAFGRDWLILLFGILAVCVLLLHNQYRAQPGRAWMAIRENELAARTIGVGARSAKFAAFVGSSALISLSGGLLAYYTGRVSADSFSLTFAISFVVMVIVGGLRSMAGVMVGTAIVTVAPLVLGRYAQGLPPLAEGFTGWFKTNVFFINSGLFGLLVLVTLLYMPRGIVPTLSSSLAALRVRIDRGSRGSQAAREHRQSGLVEQTTPSGGQPSPLLRLNGVTLSYSNGALALDGVDMTVGEGEIVGIVGRNGVGKTSLMRAITGFYRTEGVRVSGLIEIDGKAIRRASPVSTARLGVTLVPERDKVFTELTVEEHLRHVGDLDAARAAMPQEWSLFEDKWKARAGQLSGGERQLLALAMAASLRPRLLLIDEMSLGLSPIAIKRVTAAIAEMQASAGMTVIVVEQNVQVARQLCERVYLMEAGRLVADWNHRLAEAVDEALGDTDLEGVTDAAR